MPGRRRSRLARISHREGVVIARRGVRAIGDIADYANKLKLILSGFHEAAMAAHAIRQRLHPDEELHWEYSTTKGLPG